MLLVKTRVDKSSIHGVGLFACEPIAKGTQIWEMHALIDIAMEPADLEQLPEPALSLIKRLAYFDKSSNKYILSADGAQYMNHADKPNIRDDVAVRDIAAGEELTENYAYEYDL